MRTAKLLTMVLTVGILAICGTAQGYLFFTNQAPAGASWFAAGNWYESNDPNWSAVPIVSDNVYISTSWGAGTAIVDGPGAAVSLLHLGWAGFQANLTIQPGGELYVHNSCDVGFYSPSQLVINGGAFSGLDRLYIGCYTRPASPAAVEVVQYAGNVLLTNGSAEVYMNAFADHQNYLPGYPRYKLVNGYIKSKYWYIGQFGYAKVEVEGGTNDVEIYIFVGQNTGGEGVYLQSGGQVTCYRCYLGNSGAQGHYELSGGLFNPYDALYCGNGGIGTFVQTGGTFTPGVLNIGTEVAGSGHYEISRGTLTAYRINLGNKGTLKITSDEPTLSCHYYTQMANSTLDLCLTNGSVSPITIDWAPPTIAGTLNVTLQGPPESYPDQSSVVTVMTYPGSGCSGAFDAINLAPANKLLSVRVNYNANSITLDQWKYAPNGTLLVVR